MKGTMGIVAHFFNGGDSSSKGGTILKIGESWFEWHRNSLEIRSDDAEKEDKWW